MARRGSRLDSATDGAASGSVGIAVAGRRCAGHLVPDAHLAALAIEHGLVVCSTDGDFARFPRFAGGIPCSGSAKNALTAAAGYAAATLIDIAAIPSLA